MYKIYADNTLIYDSTIEEYKIGKGSISLETNKSGSFSFSIYPDHFYYNRFVRLKTVITVYKGNKIVFRGRILNDTSDHWNNKVITCEGELGFLQDSIIRPFAFNGTPEELFIKFIEEHNAQVDDFKKFKIGKVTVKDANDYIARSNSEYESALSNLNSRLIGDSLGGYFYIDHGEDGTDPIPTINYLIDFTKVSSQTIEFGSNLKNYTKTVKAEEIATAIIPLGREIGDGNASTESIRLTIASINNGVDYVYSEEGVALYGWIFKTVIWDDVTSANNLKRKAEECLKDVVNQSVTIELNAIDLHLLDHSIESFNVGDYIRVFSPPHNFDATLLCHKQTIDLLKPENDSITLGHTYSAFTETSVKNTSKVSESIGSIRSSVAQIAKTQNSYVDPNGQLTALLAQSLGFFQSTEVLANGSTIYYLHDARELSGSKTIWKLTADAFAVSTDGGDTWNAGITSEGNALVNLLSAIGIAADWIDVNDLFALSSKIGAWNINEKSIYAIVTDPNDPNIVYKTTFAPPTYLEDSILLYCEKATDGGKYDSSFKQTLIIYTDGRIKAGNVTIYPNGNVYLGDKMTLLDDIAEFFDGKVTLSSSGAVVFGDNVNFAANGSGKIGKVNVLSDGTITIGDIIKLFYDGAWTIGNINFYTDGSAYFGGKIRVDPTNGEITVSDGTNTTTIASTYISADEIIARNGASGSFTTNDGKRVTVADGIITKIETL